MMIELNDREAALVVRTLEVASRNDSEEFRSEYRALRTVIESRRDAAWDLEHPVQK